MITLKRMWRISILTPCLFLCLLLAACSKKTPDGPSSPTLERAALMQLAFPGWTADGAGRNWKLHVPSALFGPITAKNQPEDAIWDEQVDPEFVVRLSDDDATLIVLEQPLNDNGQVMDCHGCRVNYGAVQFHRHDGNWRIANRQDVFAIGGQADVGNFPKIIKLSQHAFALKIDTSYAQSGEAASWIELFELTTRGPRDLLDGKEITLNIDDDGMVGDSHCNGPAPKDGKIARTEDEKSECFHIDGKWMQDAKGETPGDMIVQYTGLKRTQDGDNLYHYHRVNERLVWKYQDGKFVLVAGKDPTAKLTF
jgi:hypothetical protein